MSHQSGQRRKRAERFILILFFFTAGIAVVFFSNYHAENQKVSGRVTQKLSQVQSGSTGSSAAALMKSKKPQLVEKKDISVPYISQQGSYATGCELVSAAMFLNYYKYPVSVQDVVSQTPFSNLQPTDNGGFTGKSPSQTFIGDPESETGFGCYAPVVVSVLNSFFRKDNRMTAVNLTGTGFDSLIPYINQNDPVIVWATINMQPSYAGMNWVLEDTGETFTWTAEEHCLVLVGYDADKYYFNDPYNSNGVVGYDKALVLQRYEELGKQAVVAVHA